MPGANAKALEKAKTLACDALIFDLEDSVAPDAKAEARAAVSAALAGGGYGRRELVIRVNALESAWGGADIEAAVAAGPDAVLVPKVSSAADVVAADAALGGMCALWVMIETPLAILNIREIAACATTTRLAGFVIGLNDLAKEQRASFTPNRDAFLTSLTLAVLAARAYGIAAIDAVHNDIADAAGFEAACRQGAMLGYDGKTVIHPSQIEIANTVFAPPEAEVAYARAVIAAFAAPENAGKGVIKVDGKMTELLHLEIARRTVAIAEAIEAAV
jgi:citrate lyase subunit beta/citryl-CoA lyase